MKVLLLFFLAAILACLAYSGRPVHLMYCNDLDTPFIWA